MRKRMSWLIPLMVSIALADYAQKPTTNPRVDVTPATISQNGSGGSSGGTTTRNFVWLSVDEIHGFNPDNFELEQSSGLKNWVPISVSSSYVTIADGRYYLEMGEAGDKMFYRNIIATKGQKP